MLAGSLPLPNRQRRVQRLRLRRAVQWGRLRSVLLPIPLLLALGLAAGCGGDAGSSSDPATLEGVAWVLQAGLDVDGWEAVAPDATFEAETVERVDRLQPLQRGRTPWTETRSRSACSRRPEWPVRLQPTPSSSPTSPRSSRSQQWSTEDGELVLLDADGAELLRYGAENPPDG